MLNAKVKKYDEGHVPNSCVRSFFFLQGMGAFNLLLLEFTFVYQFYSRKTNLVKSTFGNPAGLFAFMSFHNHFKIF